MFSTLIDRYKSLRGNIEDGRPDAKLNHNYLSLYQVQRDHRFLEVTIDGDDVVYQSIILELAPEERTILIDEFFPNDFVGLPGQRVSVAVRLDGGKKMQFKTDIVEKHLHEGAPLYVLSMPVDIEIDQRRNAFRLPIGDRVAIDSQFIGPDELPYYGRLRNVSSSGISLDVLVREESANSFHYNDLLSHLTFDFAGVNINCGVSVRSIDVDQADDSHCFIGAEFVDLPAHEQQLLDRSIMRIQRDRLRMAGNAEAQLSMG